ncbi:hypothetical protein [Photorhabdus viridis]|uniref:hypothetical protein n=1 Tax=Photorhabdus viridis TaxID=3163327 RepID=UPI00330778B1
MTSYNFGTISIAANSDIAIGTNIKWKDNKFGVAPAQTILIKVGNAFKLSAIKNVNSDTELVLIDKFPDAVSNATYFIQTSVPDTYSDAARKVTAQLGYTDELLFNLNKWMTETGVVTVTTPEGKTIQLKSINALASDISNRLTKDQNGADIPNKGEFIKNLLLFGILLKSLILPYSSLRTTYTSVAIVSARKAKSLLSYDRDLDFKTNALK